MSFGRTYIESPSKKGIANRNIMIVPCIVKTCAYCSASMKAFDDVASCVRMSMPRNPPMAKKTSAVTMKRLPMTVWLTAARRRNPVPELQTSLSSR